MTPRHGFTVAEVLTALIVVAVLAAIAIPMWRNHLLRVQRTDAIDTLIALQTAQDDFFGRNARYADGARLAEPPPGGLGLGSRSKLGFYDIEVRASDDGLGYLSLARAVPGRGQADDTRCREFTLDHNGRRRAVDFEGKDRSADCWR
jgi:type IV pilus assembly protein PilE